MMLYIHVYFNGVFREQVELCREVTTIGRSRENDIKITNSGVSSHHARIVQDGQSYFIEDAGSTNGTFVNGVPIDRKMLEFGDLISILKYTLKFSPLALQTTLDKPVKQSTHVVDGNGTVDIDISQLDKLLKQQSKANGASILIHKKDGRQRKRPLSNESFTIGKDQLSDLVIRGWFVPRSVACIDRRIDGYYLVPGKHGQVKLNGSRVRNTIKLKDGDKLFTHRVAMQFVVDKVNASAD